jgi:hypothetical protein
MRFVHILFGPDYTTGSMREIEGRCISSLGSGQMLTVSCSLDVPMALGCEDRLLPLRRAMVIISRAVYGLRLLV